MNGFGIKKELFEKMSTPQAMIKKGDYMGLGWEILNGFGNKEYAIMHTGSDKGVRTLAIILPLTGEGLILLTNGDNGYKLYFQLIPELLSLGKEIIKRAD
jgi:hypothetical protein